MPSHPSVEFRDRARLPIALLAAASALSPFAMTVAVPSLPSIGEEFNQPPGTVQFVVSTYLLGLGVAQPLQGPLCDRFGRRRMLLVSFSLFVAASVAAAFSTSMAGLVVARPGPARFGLYWSGLSLAYLLGATWTARATERHAVSTLLAYGSGAALAGAAALLVGSLLLGASTPAILLPMTLLTFSMGLTHPLSLAAAVDPFPKLAGTASGLASALGMIVSAAFTSAVGAFYDSTANPMATGIFIAVVGLELSRRFARRPARDPAQR